MGLFAKSERAVDYKNKDMKKPPPRLRCWCGYCASTSQYNITPAPCDKLTIRCPKCYVLIAVISRTSTDYIKAIRNYRYRATPKSLPWYSESLAMGKRLPGSPRD